MITNNLGITLNDLGGIRPDFQLVSGINTLICDLIARLLGKNILINEQDSSYGLDLEGMINHELDEYELSMINIQIENQLKLDQRVADVKVTGEFDSNTNTCTFFIKGVAISNEIFSFIGELSPGVRPTWKVR